MLFCNLVEKHNCFYHSYLEASETGRSPSLNHNLPDPFRIMPLIAEGQSNFWEIDSFFFFLDIEFLFFLLSFFSLYFLSLHFYAMKHSIEKPHFIFTLKERYIHRNTPENTFLLHSLVTNFLFFHRKQNTQDALIALEILSPTQVERKSADISFNSQSNV